MYRKTILSLSITAIASIASTANAFSGKFKFLAGDKECAQILRLYVTEERVGLSQLYANRFTHADYKIGESSEGLYSHSGQNRRDTQPFFRKHDFLKEEIYSKSSTLVESDFSTININEIIKFTSQTGIFTPYLYPTVEVVKQTQQIRLLDDGDLQYYYTVKSNYKASKLTPAGTYSKAFNCRYRK